MTERHAQHADDLLSAHLDGELDPATDAWVVQHVADCPACRRAASELAAARAILRSLPTVDGAPVIEGFLARHRSIIRLGGAFVVAASLVLLALGATAATARPEVVPDLPELTAAHVGEAHGDMGGMRKLAAGEGSYAAPPGLIGSAVQLSRHDVYDGDDLTALVYRDADIAVSVFEQPGRLDWSALPAGDTESVADREVWFGRGVPVVAVTELGDMVVTVVSEDRAAVLTALRGLPEWRRRDTWDRMHDACQRFTSVFALGG